MRNVLLYLRRLFNRALEGPKGWRSRFPLTSSRSTHCPSITLPQLRIFRRKGAVRSKIFDSQMAVVPSSPSPFRSRPPLFFSFRETVVFALVGRVELFLLPLFHSSLWIESRSYSSKHCERRQFIRMWWSDDCRRYLASYLCHCESVC